MDGCVEEADMAGIAAKSFDTPDESRAPAKTQVQVVDLGSVKAARMTLEPGWRWSECIKPVVGGETCQAAHSGYVISVTLHIASIGGSGLDLGPGDASTQAVTRGCSAMSPFVGLEFESKTAETYARIDGSTGPYAAAPGKRAGLPFLGKVV
jgi:hypothetical protein